MERAHWSVFFALGVLANAGICLGAETTAALDQSGSAEKAVPGQAGLSRQRTQPESAAPSAPNLVAEAAKPAPAAARAETSQIGLRQSAAPKEEIAVERNTAARGAWEKAQEACAETVKFYAKKVIKSANKAAKDSDEMEAAFRKCGESGRTTPLPEILAKETPLEKAGTERDPDEAELTRVTELVRRSEGYEAGEGAEHDCRQIPNSDAVRHGKKHGANLAENLSELREKSNACFAGLRDVAALTVLSEAKVVLTEGRRLDAVSEEDRRAILKDGVEGAADGVQELAAKFGPEVELAAKRIYPPNAGKTTALELRNAAQELESLSGRASGAIGKMLAAMPEIEAINRDEIEGLKSQDRETAVQAAPGLAPVKPVSTLAIVASQAKESGLVNGQAPTEEAAKEVMDVAVKSFEQASTQDPRPPAKFVQFSSP